MSLRFSIEEAKTRGWISETQALEMKASTHGKESNPTLKVNKKARAEHSSHGELGFCAIDGDTPQQILWRYCVLQWPAYAKNGRLVWELAGAVKGRKYSIDIAFPEHKLAIECDGWEFHGKHLKGFKRDRQKDRSLTLNGWRILRYFASEINSDRDRILSEISHMISLIEKADS